MEYAVKGNVRGRVQGEGFRAFVKQLAQENNVIGWAKNLDDGSVEVVLKGERNTVNLVQHMIASGPQAAEVRSLNWALLAEAADIEGFSIH